MSIPFDQSVADELCRRMATGRELGDVCKEEGMPSFQTVMDWRHTNPSFADQLAQAREKMYDRMVADGKEDLRRKANYTVQRIGQSGWAGPPDEWGVLLFYVSVCYSFMLLYGFNRYLNFLPSSQGEHASVVISLVLGAIFAYSTAHIAGWLLSQGTGSKIKYSVWFDYLYFGTDNEKEAKLAEKLTNYKEIEYADSKITPIISALLNSFFFYWLLLYGFGPVLTVFSSTVEKDITGRAYYYNYRRQPSSYYIITADFPERSSASFYITGEKWRSIPSHVDEVRMHVTLKQSFFGTTVESYTFLKR